MKYWQFFVLFFFVFVLAGCSGKTNVKFYDGEGNLVKEILVDEDELNNIEFPSYIVREGYTFLEWVKKHENNGISYYMNYSKNAYSINYYEDGNLLYSETVFYQDAAKYLPEDKEGYDYSFDKDLSCITSDLDVSVVYTKKTFNIVFMFNGQELKSLSVEYGCDLSDYVIELDGYDFKAWNEDLSNVRKDLTVMGDYELINYSIKYELNNSNFETSTWSSKQEFIDEFYNDFYNYLTTNYSLLGITKSGNSYSLTLNGSTATFASVTDIKNIDLYVFEKTLGHLIYAPCIRENDQPIIPESNEKYFLNSSKYLLKYQDLDRYFLNAILNNYTTYSKTYNASSGRVQIFFRFQQWQQGTNIPVFNTLPNKVVSGNSFDVENTNGLSYSIESETILNPAISNYKFLGWYDNEYFIGESIKSLNLEELGTLRDLTLYAMWDFDVNVHEVVFMGAGTVVLSTQYIEAGGSVAVPEANELFGFNFKKWDKDYNNITTDIVISAIYDPIVYGITYNTGFSSIEAPGKMAYTIADSYELPTLTKEGFLFLGWYLPDGTKIDKTTYGDIIVTAKWIEFDLDNGNVGTGLLSFAKSEEVLYENRSMFVYVKKGISYILPDEVKFTSVDKDGKISVDADGFVRGIKAGKALVIATYNNDACLIEIEVQKDNTYEYVGHTGCRGTGIVQNTESAFIEGGERGYYALECDVRVSSEGVYYIHHDDSFLTSGTVMPFVTSSLNEYGLSVGGLQASCRWDTVLSKLLVHKNGDTSTTSKLITVADYLKICKQYNTKALLELKWTTGINNNDQSKLAGLVELVKQYGMYENAIFMTSMKNCLTYLRENYPDANLQFLSGSSTTTDSNINWCIENKISLDASNDKVTKTIVEKMHSEYLYVNAYTVNSQSTANTLINLGVDYITTDDLKK